MVGVGLLQWLQLDVAANANASCQSEFPPVQLSGVEFGRRSGTVLAQATAPRDIVPSVPLDQPAYPAWEWHIPIGVQARQSLTPERHSQKVVGKSHGARHSSPQLQRAVSELSPISSRRREERRHLSRASLTSKSFGNRGTGSEVSDVATVVCARPNSAKLARASASAALATSLSQRGRILPNSRTTGDISDIDRGSRAFNSSSPGARCRASSSRERLSARLGKIVGLPTVGCLTRHTAKEKLANTAVSRPGVHSSRGHEKTREVLSQSEGILMLTCKDAVGAHSSAQTAGVCCKGSVAKPPRGNQTKECQGYATKDAKTRGDAGRSKRAGKSDRNMVSSSLSCRVCKPESPLTPSTKQAIIVHSVKKDDKVSTCHRLSRGRARCSSSGDIFRTQSPRRSSSQRTKQSGHQQLSGSHLKRHENATLESGRSQPAHSSQASGKNMAKSVLQQGTEQLSNKAERAALMHHNCYYGIEECTFHPSTGLRKCKHDLHYLRPSLLATASHLRKAYASLDHSPSRMRSLMPDEVGAASSYTPQTPKSPQKATLHERPDPTSSRPSWDSNTNPSSQRPLPSRPSSPARPRLASVPRLEQHNLSTSASSPTYFTHGVMYTEEGQEIPLANRDQIAAILHELHVQVALPLCTHFGLRYDFLFEQHCQEKKAGIARRESHVVRTRSPGGSVVTEEVRCSVAIRLRIRKHPSKGNPQTEFLSEGSRLAVLLHELCHLRHMDHNTGFMLLLRDMYAEATRLCIFRPSEMVNEVPSSWRWEQEIFRTGGQIDSEDLLKMFAELEASLVGNEEVSIALAQRTSNTEDTGTLDRHSSCEDTSGPGCCPPKICFDELDVASVSHVVRGASDDSQKCMQHSMDTLQDITVAQGATCVGPGGEKGSAPGSIGSELITPEKLDKTSLTTAAHPEYVGAPHGAEGHTSLSEHDNCASKQPDDELDSAVAQSTASAAEVLSASPLWQLGFP